MNTVMSFKHTFGRAGMRHINDIIERVSTASPISPGCMTAPNQPTGQAWVFYDWLPTHKRIDSASTVTGYHGIGGNPGAAGPAGHRDRKGQTVVGSYDFNNPQPNTHYETLDPCKPLTALDTSGIPLMVTAFYVRNKDFFVEGKVCCSRNCFSRG